jgi:hypothetical protein
MEGPHWYSPGDPELYRALRRVWSLHHRTLQPRFPPGVHRHRSIEDMNALQDRWDAENFAAHRRRSGAGSSPPTE